MKNKSLIVSTLTLAVLASCATRIERTIEEAPSAKPVTSTEIVISNTAPSVLAPAISAEWKVPALKTPLNASEAMQAAKQHFIAHANSDAFFAYFRSAVKPLKASNVLEVEVAIAKYRECLNTLGEVEIYFKRYVWPYSKSVVGGYTSGKSIRQNPNYTLDEFERAGHWAHEIAHMCGISHEINGSYENNISKFPDLLLSFPYQVGDIFGEYLKTIKLK